MKSPAVLGLIAMLTQSADGQTIELKQERVYALPAELMQTAALGMEGSTVWVLAKSGKAMGIFKTGASPAIKNAPCRTPSGDLLGSEMVASGTEGPLVTKGTEVWTCSAATGAVRRVARLPKRPASLSNERNGTFAYSNFEGYTAVELGIVRNTGASAALESVALRSEWLPTIPGTGTPSPFFPLAVAGQTIALFKDEQFTVTFIRPNGSVIREHKRTDLKRVPFSEAEKAGLAESIGISKAAVQRLSSTGKPFVTTAVVDIDSTGRALVAIGQPEGKTLLLSLGPQAAEVVLPFPVARLTIAPNGRLLLIVGPPGGPATLRVYRYTIHDS